MLSTDAPVAVEDPIGEDEVHSAPEQGAAPQEDSAGQGKVNIEAVMQWQRSFEKLQGEFRASVARETALETQLRTMQAAHAQKMDEMTNTVTQVREVVRWDARGLFTMCCTIVLQCAYCALDVELKPVSTCFRATVRSFLSYCIAV